MSTALLAVGSVAGVAGALAMYLPAHLARLDAITYRDLAEKKLDECEARDAAYEASRELQPFWSFDAPAELPEAEHEGEVLHVEHPTGEHPAVPKREHTPACPDLYYCPTVGEVESGCHGGFDVCCWAPELHQPVEAEGLARLADEVGLVQAVGCCDGHDSDECNGYGELSEACCERCPDWDWTPQPNALYRPALSDEPHHDDEDAPADDTDRTGLHLVLLAIPVALWDRLVAWLRNRLRRRPRGYTGRHWVADVQHTGQFPVVVIPAQRDGEVA